MNKKALTLLERFKDEAVYIINWEDCMPRSYMENFWKIGSLYLTKIVSNVLQTRIDLMGRILGID